MGRCTAVASSVAGSTAATPSSDSTSRVSRSARYSTTRGIAAPGTGRSTRPTTAAPSAAPSTNPAAKWVATRGPGTRARPSSSKTRTASGRPRPTPPADSARHRLNTPASPSSRHPFLSTTCSEPSTARRVSSGNRPSQSRRTPSARSVWNSVSSKSMRRPLLRRDARVVAGGFGGHGRRRLLRQAEDPFTHDVALNLRGARRDGERDPAQPVVDHHLRREVPEARPARPRSGPPGRPARGASGRTRPVAASPRCRPA